MIQELLGGGAAAGLSFGGGDHQRINKISIGSIFEGTPTSSPSPACSSTTSSSTTTNSNSANSESNQQNNLRCPRCDSSNTKFCYYNNYNLTQPRHFCKTCRRYWTKGGALRNVPIGGGCRKNKSTSCTVSASLGKSSSAASAYSKMKTVISHEVGRSGFDNHNHDHQLQYSSGPMLWASPQTHSSQLLALLRSTTTLNPNPNPVVGIKEEVMSSLQQPSHGAGAMNEPAVAITGALNGRTLGLESLGLCSPFWKNNQHQQNGFVVGEVQNTGIQELYQRLKTSSSTYNYSNHSSAVVLSSNVGSSSSSSSSFLESAAPAVTAGGGELGYNWNPAFSSSWSDLPTPNGAYQ